MFSDFGPIRQKELQDMGQLHAVDFEFLPEDFGKWQPTREACDNEEKPALLAQLD